MTQTGSLYLDDLENLSIPEVELELGRKRVLGALGRHWNSPSLPNLLQQLGKVLRAKGKIYLACVSCFGVCFVQVLCQIDLVRQRILTPHCKSTAEHAHFREYDT